ncbi:hypothetical protein ABIF94_000099 [Bradyrhizobium ottawaense]
MSWNPASARTHRARPFREFACEFNGKPVFSCALEPAISANPYVQFDARVDEAGTFKFSWTDDDGTVITAEEKIALKA